jgi:hypothetical protein
MPLNNTCIDGPTISIGQGVGGVYALGEGICTVIDGLNCAVLAPHYVYFGGGTLQMVSAVCLMGSSIVVGLGLSCKKVGNHIVDSANVINPFMNITKTV